MPELDAGQLRVMPEVRPPAGLDEMLAYLNAIPDYTAEDTYPMNNYSIVEWSGGVIVCDGDQPLFFAETYDEAYSFVVGLAVMANEFLKRVIVPFQQLHENPSDIP